MKSILLVDDDALFRELVADLIKEKRNMYRYEYGRWHWFGTL